jgi:glycosyltransferase involved in cell wall biosynthesis
MTEKFPPVSFVIPIFNSGWLLRDCLFSIRNQNYPKNCAEILIPDGGSQDNGPAIAKQYGATVVPNPKILAEPGFMLGASLARGELIVYMGADNRLADRAWIRTMVKPFQDPDIIAAYPWHKSKKTSTWYTKYFNAFTDPINHFILGDSANPLYFRRVYDVIRNTANYEVYRFTIEKFPMLAFDQGFMIRKSFKRNPQTEYDDILPVLDLIKMNHQIAFVKNAANYHLTLERGFAQFSKKMRWIIDNNIGSDATDFGMPTRMKYYSLTRKVKLYVWPIYAISIIGPIVVAIIGLARDRKKEWLYHPPITYIMLGLVVYEYLRVKIFHRKSLTGRQ